MPTAPTSEFSAISDLQWWGEQSFALGQSQVWQLGPLHVRITRDQYEWRLEYHRPKPQNDTLRNWSKLATDSELPQPTQLERFLFAKTNPKLILLPRLADRSVVVKPINPIFIPAGQQGTMYVSTPVWLTALTARKAAPLFDIPIIRPNDTWFGPDTLKGEICYATPVFGRTQLEQLPVSALHAITPVHFRNRSNSQLQLERMNLPIDTLPLFQSISDGQLWTSEIDVIQESNGRPPRVKIDHHTPELAGQVRFINPPRNSEGGFFRIFDSFF